MPVIGRLDEQVEEVLISPLERKREQGERQRQENRQPPRGEAEAKTSELEKRAERDELPVWLL